MPLAPNRNSFVAIRQTSTSNPCLSFFAANSRMGSVVPFKRFQPRQSWLWAALAVLFVVVTIFTQPSSSPSAAANNNKIVGHASVIDGDTIEIHGTRIRLFGIDAPEGGQTCTVHGKPFRCGQQAAFALADMIGNKTVECRPKDRDRYGRIVAVCLAGGKDLNAWLVANGLALAYRHYSTDYVGQEEQAAKSKLGMWQDDFIPPWEWRRGNRR